MNLLGRKNSLFASAILEKHTKFGQYQFEDPRLVLLQQEQEQTESESFANVLLNFSVLLQEMKKADYKIQIGNFRIFVENFFRNISYYQSLIGHSPYVSHNLTQNNVVFLNRQVQNLQKYVHEVIQTLSLTNQSVTQVSLESVIQEVNHVLQFYRQSQNLSVQENQIASQLVLNKNFPLSVSDTEERQKALFPINTLHQRYLNLPIESSLAWQQREVGKNTELSVYRVHYTDGQRLAFQITTEQRLSEIWERFQKQNILRLERTFLVTPLARDLFAYEREADFRSILEWRIRDFGHTKTQKTFTSFLLPFPAQSVKVQDVQQFGRSTLFRHDDLPFAEKASWITQKSFEKHSLVFLQNNIFSENWRLMENSVPPVMYQYPVGQLRELLSRESHSYRHLSQELVISHFYAQDRFFSKILTQSLSKAVMQSFLFSFAERMHGEKTQEFFLKRIQNTSQNISTQVLEKVLQAFGKPTISEEPVGYDIFIKTSQLTKKIAGLRFTQANDMPESALRAVLSAQMLSKITAQNVIQTINRENFKYAQQMKRMPDDELQSDKESAWLWNTQRQALLRNIYLETVGKEKSVYQEKIVHEQSATRILRDQNHAARSTEQMEIGLQTVQTNLLKQMLYPRFLVQKQGLQTIQNASPVTGRILSGLYKMCQIKMAGQTEENRPEVLAYGKGYAQKTEIHLHPLFSLWKKELMQRISYRTGGPFDALLFHRLRQSWDENGSSFQEISRLLQAENTVHILQETFQNVERQGRKNDVQPFYARVQKLSSVLKKNMFYPETKRTPEKHGKLAQPPFLSEQQKTEVHLLPQRKNEEIASRALSVLGHIKKEKTLDFQKTFSVSRYEAIKNQMVQQREQGNFPVQAERHAETPPVRMDTQQNVPKHTKSSFSHPSTPWFRLESTAMREQSSVLLQCVKQKKETLHFLQAIENSVRPLRASAEKQQTPANIAIPVSKAERQLEAIRILPDFSVLKRQVQNIQKEKLLQKETISHQNQSRQAYSTSDVERQTMLSVGWSQNNVILLKNEKEERLYSIFAKHQQLGERPVMYMPAQKEILHNMHQLQKELVSEKKNLSVLSFLRSFYEKEGLLESAESRVFRNSGGDRTRMQSITQRLLAPPASQRKQTSWGQQEAQTSRLAGQKQTTARVPAAVSMVRAERQLVNHQKPVVSQQRLPSGAAQTELRYLKKVQKEQESHLERQTGALKKLEQQLEQQKEQITKLLHRQSIPEQMVPDSRQLADQVIREIQKQLRLESQRRGR